MRNDVVIIGAGVAGLTAAWSLQRAGRGVTVLEARTRTGGRAFSPQVDGHPYDLGPTWVWDSERAVIELMEALGVPTFPPHVDGLDVYQTDRLQHGRLPRSAVPERRIRGGAQAITDALAERVEGVQLGCAAHGIRQDGDGVVVETSSGEVRGRAVLAALPPRLLARALTVPDAPVEMWKQVPTWMADVAKVACLFDEAVWVDKGMSGRGASAVGPMVEIHDMSGPEGQSPALFGFVPRSLDREDLEGAVRAQLQVLFGPDAQPRRVLIQRWWTEPRTALQTEPQRQSLFGHADLRRPLWGGRLQLISCETSGVSPGHMNGAVERAHGAVGSLL